MYKHLSKEQRVALSVLKREGFSLREIAARLGVSPSTVSRELKRNRSGRADVLGGYHAGEAQRRAAKRSRAANQRLRKITPNSRLEQLLEEKIAVAKWSPEQVAGWLKLSPGRATLSPQTIYDWIYSSRRDLLAHLHCRKGKYRRTRADKPRRQARDAAAAVRHITRRPASADSRLVYGHWEGDTVHGATKSGYIATFVDRKSGYLTAVVLPKEDFGAAGFAAAAKAALGDLPARHRRTLTLDNGPEMAYCERIERLTGLKVYYATPYHSWERGCNENANGLLRYFFPKKMNFSSLPQEQLDRAVELINNRPRKRLNWQTPAKVLKR